MKGALVGCGFFSQHHLAAWRRLPNVQLVAACDLVLEKAQATGLPAYSSLEEILRIKDLDFVDIVTRSTAHLDVVSKVSAAGLPAICQKPLAPDWQSAALILKAVQRNQTRLMVHDNWRWQSWYRLAHTHIAQGDIGIPLGYSFRCRLKAGLGEDPYPKQSYFRQLPRFLIDEVLVHHIDTARFLFGDIASVYAEGATRNKCIAGEDHALLTLHHDNGVLGSIDGNLCVDHPRPGPSLDEAIFEGETGSIRITPLGEVWLGERKVEGADPNKGYRGDSVYNAQAHFIECLQTGTPFETEAQNYLEKTFATVEAAYASIASRSLVEIKHWSHS